MYYIYLIRKQGIPVYVGFTSKTIEERWKGHIKHSKKKKCILYNSMIKNGIDCFTIEQLYESEDLNHTLNYMELHFIWLYKTYYEYGGYNMTLGGEGTIKLGTLSEQERKKRYIEKNKDKIKEYHTKNKDKRNKQSKEYYEKTKVERRKYSKEHYKKTKIK